MKKKILFLTSSVGIGGNEKVLLNITKVLQRQKFDISIIVLDKIIPPNTIPNDIKLLDFGRNYNIVSSGFKKGVIQALKQLRPHLIFNIIKEKFLDIKTRKRNYYINFWKAHKNIVDKINMEFDVAVAFGLGIQVLTTIDKINAKAKIAWVNNDCSKCLDQQEIAFLNDYYSSFDKIVAVTPTAQQGYLTVFPTSENKTLIIKDIFDETEILERSTLEGNPFEHSKTPVIVTVGRICVPKGYYLLLDAAKILKDTGETFSWKIVGNGDATEFINKAIELKVEDCVEFCGAKSNPYPYIKNCDIYAQTSLWEGNCLTLIEAMLLERPIVSTNFPTALDKISDGINGLICEMNAESLANKIKILLHDENIKMRFTNHLTSNRPNNDDVIAQINNFLFEV